MQPDGAVNQEPHLLGGVVVGRVPNPEPAGHR
jgi:hypothetical protein